jgi:hypothetical protein
MLSLSRFKVNLYNLLLGEGSEAEQPTLILNFLQPSDPAPQYYVFEEDPA